MTKKFHHVTHSKDSIVWFNSRTKSWILVLSIINPKDGSACGAKSSVEMLIEWKVVFQEGINVVASTTIRCKSSYFYFEIYYIFDIQWYILLMIYFRLPHGGPEADRERRDLSFDRYDREDPCTGMKQIITGFSKWSDRYISTCSGQKNHSHQIKRMTKWRGILNEGRGWKLYTSKMFCIGMILLGDI